MAVKWIWIYGSKVHNAVYNIPVGAVQRGASRRRGQRPRMEILQWMRTHGVALQTSSRDLKESKISYTSNGCMTKELAKPSINELLIFSTISSVEESKNWPAEVIPRYNCCLEMNGAWTREARTMVTKWGRALCMTSRRIQVLKTGQPSSGHFWWTNTLANRVQYSLSTREYPGISIH